MKKILAISGSSRLQSINTLLLEKAAQMARDAGAEVDVLDLRSLELPIYDGDYEAANGLPPGALTLKNAMKNADGFLIACPEYNSYPTPLLLNALDWASRKGDADEPPMSAFKGKSAGLLAASPGPVGGLRGLWAMRTFLMNVGVTVIPSMSAVGSASPDTFSDPDFESSSNGSRVRATLDALLSLSV